MNMLFWCMAAMQVVTPPQPALDTAAVTAAVHAEMTRTGAPGAAIAIVENGELVYARGFGVASAETGGSITEETLFRIGSVTKPLTALAALLLREQGRVSFAEGAGTYLPGLHPAVAQRTLHQLLSHTAGVIALPAADGFHDDEALQRRMLSWTDTVLFADAGEVYSYSSPGYWLAGAILERVTERYYADAMGELVFAPLGMERSTLRPLSAFTWPVALDHRRMSGRVAVARPYPDDTSTWPGGSVFSSAVELARFAAMLLRGGMVDGTQAVPEAVVQEMMRPQAPAVSGNCAYTYGLSHCDSGTVRTLSHYGFRSGSGAVFTLIPERRAAIVILSNIAGGIFGQTESEVLKMLGVERASVPPRARAATGEERTALAGAYAAGRDTLTVAVESDGELRLRARGAGYPVRLDAGIDSMVLLMGENGSVVQTFHVVRGRVTGRRFLHDGLNAFRKVD